MSTEFLPGGLLPGIAETFDRPVADAGQLVTIFAAAVIVTTTPLAALTRRLPRKPLALAGLAAVGLAGFGAAAAPSYELLMAARAAGGIAHGLFWAVAAAYAADLVPRAQLGRAMAITAAGGSLAGVLGVPLGNALGQAFGWRVAFGAIAAVGVVMLFLAIWLLPPVRHAKHRRAHSEPTNQTGRRASLGGVLLLCCVILLVVIGQTNMGTYSVVWLTEIASIPSSLIPVYLLGTGLAALVAVSTAGRLADRYPNSSLIIGVALVALLGAAQPLMLLWGVAPLVVVAVTQSMAFAIVPVLLQTRMMRVASPGQRPMAAALQTTAFNIAIGGGAVIGGLVVSNIGLTALPWASAILTATGLVVLLIASPGTRSTAAQKSDSRVESST